MADRTEQEGGRAGGAERHSMTAISVRRWFSSVRAIPRHSLTLVAVGFSEQSISLHDVPTSLKWPNTCLGDAKLAGILLEQSGADHLGWSQRQRLRRCRPQDRRAAVGGGHQARGLCSGPDRQICTTAGGLALVGTAHCPGVDGQGASDRDTAGVHSSPGERMQEPSMELSRTAMRLSATGSIDIIPWGRHAGVTISHHKR
jgi:hypothetical protein